MGYVGSALLFLFFFFKPKPLVPQSMASHTISCCHGAALVSPQKSIHTFFRRCMFQMYSCNFIYEIYFTILFPLSRLPFPFPCYYLTSIRINCCYNKYSKF